MRVSAAQRLSADCIVLCVCAQDVAQLLHIHEANVARRIASFLPHERARMHVLCVQSNGTKATLMLSVLSVDGMTRLLTASKKAVRTRNKNKKKARSHARSAVSPLVPLCALCR